MNTENDREELLRHALDSIVVSARKNKKAWAWSAAIDALNLAIDAGLQDDIMRLISTTGTEKPEDILGHSNYPHLQELREIIYHAMSPALVVVGKYPGTVQWLEAQGYKIDTIVSGRVEPEQVEHRDVVGNLPYRLAVLTHSISIVEIPGRPPERLGDELTAEELAEYGAYLKRYRVIESVPLPLP